MNSNLFLISLIIGFLVAVLLAKIAYDQSIGMWQRQGFVVPRNKKEKDVIKRYWQSKKNAINIIKKPVYASIVLAQIIVATFIGTPYSIISMLSFVLFFICLFKLSTYYADSKIRK